MVVLNTASWMRMADTARARSRCSSTVDPPGTRSSYQPGGGLGCKSSVLSPPGLERAHERHQLVDAVLGEGIVDGRPHPADRAVAFEAVEAGGGRLLDE